MGPGRGPRPRGLRRGPALAGRRRGRRPSARGDEREGPARLCRGGGARAAARPRPADVGRPEGHDRLAHGPPSHPLSVGPAGPRRGAARGHRAAPHRLAQKRRHQHPLPLAPDPGLVPAPREARGPAGRLGRGVGPRGRRHGLEADPRRPRGRPRAVGHRPGRPPQARRPARARGSAVDGPELGPPPRPAALGDPRRPAAAALGEEPRDVSGRVLSPLQPGLGDLPGPLGRAPGRRPAAPVFEAPGRLHARPAPPLPRAPPGIPLRPVRRRGRRAAHPHQRALLGRRAHRLGGGPGGGADPGKRPRSPGPRRGDDAAPPQGGAVSDVCLILEGTYPFVSGGVSTWVHQLVSSMEDVRFSIVYISPFPNPRREYKYRLPANVVAIQDLYLHEPFERKGLSSLANRKAGLERLAAAHEGLFEGRLDAFREALAVLRDPEHALTFDDLFVSKESWDLLEHLYKARGEDVSFLDFFWTWRSIYLPLVKTCQAPLPPARLYHTVSTGYAGVLAAIARQTMDAGMLLTEHGVYTHERLLEISQSTWIYTPHQERFRVQRELSFFKRFWLASFDFMGRLTYDNADKILTLYEGNRVKQIVAGAPAERVSIIPNGIDVARYQEIPRKPQGSDAKVVSYIGRVVPIKDVKTFLHMARIVLNRRPGTVFHVVGPTDEEPEYTQECRDVAAVLGLGEAVQFLGKLDIHEYYSRTDLVVLTSLSEAQPYAVLEANAVGIPVVATDVGACREMLEGRSPEDRAVGPSGLLTSVSDPEGTAAAVLRLLSEPGLYNSCAEAGRTRAARFYDQGDLISRYLNLYEQMMK
ncbi:DUF3492 domain-containing protein [bacterium]|nr:MAG: DUF3492 domain-containing protein [bacterium]